MPLFALIFNPKRIYVKATKKRQSLVGVLADHHVGTVTLQLFTSQTDVIASVISAIQSTTITSVMLCLESRTTLMFLKQVGMVNLTKFKLQIIHF